jgi:hypothetical protein
MFISGCLDNIKESFILLFRLNLKKSILFFFQIFQIISAPREADDLDPPCPITLSEV